MPFESYTTMYDTGISHKYMLNKSNILSSYTGRVKNSGKGEAGGETK